MKRKLVWAVLAVGLATFAFLHSGADVDAPDVEPEIGKVAQSASEPWEVFICEWSPEGLVCAGEPRPDLQACLPVQSDLIDLLDIGFEKWHRRPVDPPTGIDFAVPEEWVPLKQWRDSCRAGSLWHCVGSTDRLEGASG